MPEFDSEANHLHIRQRLAGAKHYSSPQPRRGIRQGTPRGQMQRNFPQKQHGQRVKGRTLFSVVKRKLSAGAPVRRLVMPVRQTLLLGLT